MAVQSFVVATSQSRIGTFTSSAVQAPAGILLIRFLANISSTDKLADGKTLDLNVEHSTDGTTNWQSAGGFGWTSYGPGGYTDGKGNVNPDPSYAFNPQQFPQEFFRVTVAIPQTLTVGASIEVTT